jgi:hypothetical protein
LVEEIDSNARFDFTDSRNAAAVLPSDHSIPKQRMALDSLPHPLKQLIAILTHPKSTSKPNPNPNFQNPLHAANGIPKSTLLTSNTPIKNNPKCYTAQPYFIPLAEICDPKC